MPLPLARCAFLSSSGGTSTVILRAVSITPLAYHTRYQHRVWPGESAFVGTLPHTSPATFRASASNALAAFFVLGRGREVWPCATQEFGRRQEAAMTRKCKVTRPGI